MRTLMRLELSRNQLGKKCAQALGGGRADVPRALPTSTSRITSSASTAAIAIASVMLAASVSLKYLNIAANNLCNVAP